MTRSYSKIELYNTAAVLKHTITSSTNNSAIDIHTHDVLTSDIGSFAFTLPHNPPVYVYNDVTEHWTAKVYLNAYKTTTTTDLVIAGRIQKITGPLQTETGYIKLFECKGLGELLERRHKKNKRYLAVEADDIVAEIASDLSLTGDLATDTTAETITVRTESYFDLLKKVSDYWASAGTQVKKDFYVSPAGVLVWKARPIRTAGVETLNVANKNILSYKVVRDKLSVKNNITVLGAASAPDPLTKDDYTDATSGTYGGGSWSWAADHGALSTDDGSVYGVKAGTYSIKCFNNVSSYECDMTLTLPYSVNIRHVNKLNFWQFVNGSNPIIQLYAPDSSNYFQADLTLNSAWFYESIGLGEDNEYDADENPTGRWTKTGSPNWWDITAARFHTDDGEPASRLILIDKLYFTPERWTYTASDATSITAYGQNDAEYTDENLSTTTDCEKRAKTLLYQLKDPVVRADVTVNGCTNIKIGDRIPLTIPAEDLTASNFDVVAVTHDFNSTGFTTVATMVNSANTRMIPPTSNSDVVSRKIKSLQEVTSDLYSRIVR